MKFMTSAIIAAGFASRRAQRKRRKLAPTRGPTRHGAGFHQRRETVLQDHEGRPRRIRDVPRHDQGRRRLGRART